MAIQKVKEFLKKRGFEDRLIETKDSSATVELAAKAVGTEPDRIAKSLTFLVEERPIMILVSGESRISNPKFKDTFHVKARMIPRERVETLIGHDVGGVCPFGINEGVDIYLDNSLKKYDVIFPAGGNANSAVRLSVDELEEITQPKAWVDVVK